MQILFGTKNCCNIIFFIRKEMIILLLNNFFYKWNEFLEIKKKKRRPLLNCVNFSTFFGNG